MNRNTQKIFKTLFYAVASPDAPKWKMPVGGSVEQMEEASVNF